MNNKNARHTPLPKYVLAGTSRGSAGRSWAPLVTTGISIPPSDRPAADFPEYEPTPLDLATIEELDEVGIESRLSAAATLAAYELRRRELLGLRAELPRTAFAPDPDEVEDEEAHLIATPAA